MKLTLVVLSIALVAGMLAGGRLSNLASVRIRWTVLALLGLALQVVPVPGAVLPLVLLYASFVLLAVFAVRNVRLAGFALILVGLASNFTVIAVNGGMPVTRHALVAVALGPGRRGKAPPRFVLGLAPAARRRHPDRGGRSGRQPG